MNDTYGTTDKILLVETGRKYIFDCIPVTILHCVVQWNLSVTGPKWQSASISPGNGLAPHMRQGISWTNADPVHWRIYVALGGDELVREVGYFYDFVLCVCLLTIFLK